MKNIAFDLPKKYPPVEPPDFASGEVFKIDSENILEMKCLIKILLLLDSK